MVYSGLMMSEMDQTACDRVSAVFYQNAVSMYCRLGFAVKKGQVFSSDQLHPTWKNAPSVNRLKYVTAVLAPNINHPSSCNGNGAITG